MLADDVSSFFFDRDSIPGAALPKKNLGKCHLSPCVKSYPSCLPSSSIYTVGTVLSPSDGLTT